jgi:hypothetical protein
MLVRKQKHEDAKTIQKTRRKPENPNQTSRTPLRRTGRLLGVVPVETRAKLRKNATRTLIQAYRCDISGGAQISANC